MENSEGNERARLALELIDNCPENVEPVDLINQIFTNEDSLNDIDDCLELIDGRLEQLDNEIRVGLREAAELAQKRQEATTDLRAVKSATQLLTDEIQSISHRVRHTREMTDEIAREIYFLDRGRENITYVIGCLQRLVMLRKSIKKGFGRTLRCMALCIYYADSGIQNLRKLAAERQYSKCTDLIKAIDSLAQFFVTGEENAASIPQVGALLEEKEILFNDLKRQICDELEAAIEDCDELEWSQNTLCKDCCNAADAIYPTLRNETLMKVALKLLEPYKRNFAFMASSTKKEDRKRDAANALQNTDKRQLWLKRCLEDCRQPFGKMFPDEWKFEHFVCQQFALITRQHVIALLEICSDILEPSTLIYIMGKMNNLERFLEECSHTERGNDEKKLQSSSSITFKGSITRVFDSFLGGWYMQKDAEFYNLLSSSANEVDEVATLCDSNSITPPDGNRLPKRVYKSLLDLFRELKAVHAEAQNVDSPQMNRDVFKLARKSVSMYLDILSIGKRPMQLLNVLTNRNKNTTILLAKYICVNVLQICSISCSQYMLREECQPVDTTASTNTYFDNRIGKPSAWISTLMKEKKVKFKHAREVDDFGDIPTVISTLYFMEESLPAMELMLQKDLINDTTNTLFDLSNEMDRTWELRQTYFYLCCMHFVISVIEPELSMKYVEWRRQQQLTKTPQLVESRNPCIDAFLNVWIDWMGLMSQCLPELLNQFLFDCCATLLVAELTNLFCTQLSPFDSNTLTSQLLLDLSFLVDSLTSKFPTLSVDVAKSQLQAVTTAVKIVASSQSEQKDVSQTDGDNEPDTDELILKSSHGWNAMLEATAHYEVIWDGFVESTACGHNRRDPLFADLLKVMITGDHFGHVKPSEIQTVTKILSLRMEKLRWNMAIFDVQ